MVGEANNAAFVVMSCQFTPVATGYPITSLENGVRPVAMDPEDRKTATW